MGPISLLCPLGSGWDPPPAYLSVILGLVLSLVFWILGCGVPHDGVPACGMTGLVVSLVYCILGLVISLVSWYPCSRSPRRAPHSVAPNSHLLPRHALTSPHPKTTNLASTTQTSTKTAHVQRPRHVPHRQTARYPRLEHHPHACRRCEL